MDSLDEDSKSCRLYLFFFSNSNFSLDFVKPILWVFPIFSHCFSYFFPSYPLLLSLLYQSFFYSPYYPFLFFLPFLKEKFKRNEAGKQTTQWPNHWLHTSTWFVHKSTWIYRFTYIYIYSPSPFTRLIIIISYIHVSSLWDFPVWITSLFPCLPVCAPSSFTTTTPSLLPFFSSSCHSFCFCHWLYVRHYSPFFFFFFLIVIE